MCERGLDVDHSTVFRWVQRYAPEIDKRIRPYLKMSGTSYRVDETYIKVGKSCKYLYRAVDKEGQTIGFMLSAKRDVSAAKRFFKKMRRAEHRRLPFSISVAKNAAYPEAFCASQEERTGPKGCKLDAEVRLQGRGADGLPVRAFQDIVRAVTGAGATA